MNLHLKVFRKLLAHSVLSPAEQEELLIFFSRTSDFDLGKLVFLLERHPEWIRLMYHNMITKQKTFEKKSASAWRSVIEEELNQLQQVKGS